MTAQIDPKQILTSYLTSAIRNLETGIPYTTFSVFFEPTQEFIEWMKANYHDKTIIEVGAGKAVASGMLQDAGLNVVATDLYPPSDASIRVVAMNAAHWPYAENQIGMLCRPCRGDWIHAAICKAVEGCGTMLYVGLEKHHEADLEPLPYKVEKVLVDIGESGECVWRITK